MKITDLITLNENDDFHSYFKNLQKTDPRFKNLRIHGDPEHDELRRQDAEARAKRLATPPAPPAVPSPEEIDQAKEKLLNLERKFDPNYEYSDDYTVWSRNNELAKQIRSLKQFIARGDQGVAEGHPDEKEDKALIRKMVKQQALKKENMLAREQHEDHEISMATSELKNVYINAKKLFDIIKQRSEQEGLDAWQQSKITKASDYLNSVLTAIRGEPRR